MDDSRDSGDRQRHLKYLLHAAPSRREMVPHYQPVADRSDALRMVQSRRALGRGERLGSVRRYGPDDDESFLVADDRFNRDQQRFFIHEREIPIQERENANPQSRYFQTIRLDRRCA